ncbi:universal stress protein [Streptomyces sp. RS10V-4]|uniref:universal stress protein n=1 Tax=Streptomyces rhizoryzae TaxID=2932493 RepID=UPI00200531D7|nr:universal stress protein [Streptomyces rhizoryzae]MCK7622214.1 universal stress protein [Streptomyces rhizoryzae]
MSSEVPRGAVVAGVSRSPTARSAVEWAADAAARRGRELCLVHAQEWPAGAAPKERRDEPGQIWASHYRAAGRTLLQEHADAAAERVPGLRVTTRLGDGHPTAVLREAAEDAALLVIGSRQVSGPLEAVTFTTVGRSLAGHPPCPVVLVPGDAARCDPLGPVVVGVDGSAASVPAVAFAFEEAALARADLVAVQVRRPRHGDWPEDLQESLIDVSQALAGWGERYPQVLVRQEVVVGPPPARLAEAAATGRCLVVGSRGLGGFRGLVLGSTSRTLAHFAPGPLAIVPHDVRTG